MGLGMGLAKIALATALLSPLQAWAGPAEQDNAALQKLGLAGEWAVDCSRPASRDNAHLFFTPAVNGPPLYRMATGGPAPDIGTFIHDIKVPAVNQIALSMPFAGHDFDLVMIISAGKLRTLQSVNDRRETIIRNGVTQRTRRPTDWLSRCSGPDKG